MDDHTAILDLTSRYTRPERPDHPTHPAGTTEASSGSEGTATVVAHAYRTDPVTLVFACGACGTVQTYPAPRIAHTGAPACSCGAPTSYRGWRIDEETPTRRDERPTPTCDRCGLTFTSHRDGTSTHDEDQAATVRAEDADADHVPYSMV